MDYHRLLLEALSETAAKLIQIRTSIDTGDTNRIIALAPQLQATQQKVGDFELEYLWNAVYASTPSQLILQYRE